MRTGAGVNAGLRIALYADTNEFYCSSTRSEGFLILFHAPHERPRMMISQMIPISHDVRFIITPIIEIVAPTISLIPMESRNCCFDHECHLPFFRSGNSIFVNKLLIFSSFIFFNKMLLSPSI